MTDILLLKEYIKNSGMTIVSIAEKTGISRETFYSRLKNPDFRLSEIYALTDVLRLNKDERDKIFFAKRCE